MPHEQFRRLFKGSVSRCLQSRNQSMTDDLLNSVDLHFSGEGVMGTLKKCEKNVKSYFLRETVKQQPVG